VAKYSVVTFWVLVIFYHLMALEDQIYKHLWYFNCKTFRCHSP